MKSMSFRFFFSPRFFGFWEKSPSRRLRFAGVEDRIALSTTEEEVVVASRQEERSKSTKIDSRRVFPASFLLFLSRSPQINKNQRSYELIVIRKRNEKLS